MPARIILVRHGLSTFNKLGRMQGCDDRARLNNRGREAASMVGQWLKSGEIHSIISSPLTRARETAELIRAALGQPLPLQLLYRLREIELFGWEGMLLKDIRTQFPEDFRVWTADPDNFSLQHEGQEIYPMRNLYQRTSDFWTKDFPDHFKGTTLLVSHGGTIQALVNTALGLGPENHQSLQVSNCGVTTLDYHPAHKRFTLSGLNNTSALKEKLPKLKAGKTGLRVILVPASRDLDINFLAPVCKSLGITQLFHTGTTKKLQGQLDSNGLSMPVHEFDCLPRSVSNPLKGLIARMSVQDAALQHILVVAPAHSLGQVIQYGFGFPGKIASGIEFRKQSLSAIHVSPGHPRPILQCVNFPAEAVVRDLTG